MKALRADLLDFTAEPVFGQPSLQGVRYRPDHWLLIGDDGRIAGVQPPGWQPGADVQAEDRRGHLLLPGFIDTHVHSAQLEVVASWGSELIDWLERHTFPAELAWHDAAFAAAGSARFLDALLAHGSTAAVVFPTVHAGSVDALFQAAQARGMRLVAGKVLMDRHAPDGLRDDVDGARADCLALFERWHGRGRCSGAVTVRFAPTSTPEQLAMAGELCRTDPTLVLQTHVAENRAEVDWVARLFPDARSYLDVYDRHGLLHARSVLAHGIWLDDADRARVAASGAQIAHCPSSNLFLGSGLFDWARARDAGCTVTLASDVGGGSSLSMPRTLADAYRVQALRGTRVDAFTLLYAATRGAARSLGLGHEIGGLDAGLAADVVLWDWARGPVAGHRDAVACGQVPPLPAQGLHERLFAWAMQADQGSVVATWVHGACRYRRPGAGVGVDEGTASC
ncbi:MAG: guanine deaminase [Rubrivivax sp.]